MSRSTGCVCHQPLPVEMTIKIHRGHTLDDLIAVFEDTSVDPRVFVKIITILPDGQEGAMDDGGVTRDCLSEFWHHRMDDFCH